MWIADEERGLVSGLWMFHHPMHEKVLTLVMPDGTRGERDMTTQRTFDMAAGHVLKIRGGRIHEIEATGFTLPLYSRSGWSEFLRWRDGGGTEACCLARPGGSGLERGGLEGVPAAWTCRPAGPPLPGIVTRGVV